MSPKNTAGGLAGMAATLLLLFPPLGSAQQTATAVVAARSEAPVVVSRADRIRQQAEKLYAVPHRWGEVVELHVRAAHAAEVGDPLRATDLWTAGSVAVGLGWLADGGRYMEECAAAALEVGDVALAAQAYIMAATVAKQLGQEKQVDHLVAHARALRESGLLPERDCDCLDTRIALLTGVGGPPR